MTIPEIELIRAKKLLNKFCNQVPMQVRDRLKYNYEIDGLAILLLNERFIMSGKWISYPVAKFTYDLKLRMWKLWWKDSKNKYYDYYKEIKQSKNPGVFETLLEELDNDPLEVFLL